MSSEASRSEVERLHRLLIEASIELAQLDVRLDEARAADSLWPILRRWSDAAEALDETVQRERSGLQDEGAPKARIDRLREQLVFLQQRSRQFDLEFDLDDCAAAWDEVEREVEQLRGPHGDAVVRLQRELRPGVDDATAELFEARRKQGFVEAQHRRAIELEKERDRARERFERLRLAYLEALRALEAAEAAPPPVEKPDDAPEAPVLALPEPVATEPEPELPLEPLVEPEPPPELELVRLADREPVEEPALRVEVPDEPELPPPVDFLPLPDPERPEKPAAQAEPLPEPELPPLEFARALDPEPAGKPTVKKEAPAEPELPPPLEFVRLAEPRLPEKASVKKEAPPEAELPPPPKFVRAPERKAPPKMKPATLKAAEPAEEEAPAPAPAPSPEPSAAHAGIVVERVARAGPFPPSDDGIGRGNQSAAIWFRGGDREASSVQGTFRIALGCATRLEVMPSVELFSGVPGQPQRGKLTLLLVSTGGHLSGAHPEGAKAAARLHAADAAAGLAARLGALGSALLGPIREVLEHAAAGIFARALPGADRGKMLLEPVLEHDFPHGDLAARLERMLSRLLRRRGAAGKDGSRLDPRAIGGERIAAAAGGGDGRTHAGAARGPAEERDFQEIDSGAADTWIGSGEGAKVFPEVFGAFLPAEGALVVAPLWRGAKAERPGKDFLERAREWSEKGEHLLGKGMHYAELGMHGATRIERAAEKVESFADRAGKFLDRLGLHPLAGFAEKARSAAGWVDDEAREIHRQLKTVDRGMGKAKKALAAVLDEPRRLDLATLSKMESFLGDDFSGVRVHTGAGAAEVTRRFDAEAVTVRDHIFFAPGRFNPSSAEGQQLIAHELTHVLQEGRRNLDVRTAEREALHAEQTYGHGPAMETLNLGRPPPDFRLAAEGEGSAAPAGIYAAKRTRSRGHEVGGKDALPDGEELLEEVSGRVYDLLMEELEQAFESR